MYYRSLSLPNERQPYTIVKVVEKEDGNILLFLRGNEFEGEFMSLLLPEHSRQAFRDASRLNIENNGKDAKLKLKYYGYTNFDGNKIIRISGKEFTRYLV